MNRSRSMAMIAIAAITIPITAFGQSASASRSVTHSPSIHRGNVSQSAIFVGPQRTTSIPGPIVGRGPGRGPGHGHNGHGHDRHGRCFGSPFYFGSGFYHVHGPACVFTEGYYTTTNERVFVPARYETQYVPPRYELRVRPDGRTVNVLVQSGYYTKVYIPERFETRPVQVYVPASWSCGYYY